MIDLCLKGGFIAQPAVTSVAAFHFKQQFLFR